MAKKYVYTFKIFDAEEQARSFCDNENAKNSKKRTNKNRLAHYTPWQNQNRTETKFVAWYFEKQD